MSEEPVERIELGEGDSGHKHWVEIYVNGDRVKAVKKNSMPVFDSSKYRYSIGSDGLEFVSGDKSCSGAGMNRPDSPSDEVDKLIRGAVSEVVAER